MTYTFLQNYWWVLVSLLGGLLVALMFVQGVNVQLINPRLDSLRKRMALNASGRKWELTFTTLVTFGGAFFASFPLFYSTSFGGAYWVWVLLLVTFVFQAVSYEFAYKKQNLLGSKFFRLALTANGILAPFLVGTAVGTFFTGSDFVVNREQGRHHLCVLPGHQHLGQRLAWAGGAGPGPRRPPGTYGGGIDHHPGRPVPHQVRG